MYIADGSGKFDVSSFLDAWLVTARVGYCGVPDVVPRPAAD
jgi:hypothetical protein